MSQLAVQPVELKDDSDYGEFDIDVEEIEQLLTQVESQQNIAPLLVTDIEDYEPPRGVILPKVLGFAVHTLSSKTDNPLSRNIKSPSADRSRRGKSPTTPAEIESDNKAPDTRSPLERFRKPPKKTLSVTDLVSPAWCELQYFYTLSKHGRKKRTPAMKQGTALHQALEREIHVTVPIETAKLEDSWGLRIWNICQGLRTLRETGKTRELEIWGTIGGELVNGIIDELSYECPDPDHEDNSKDDIAPNVPEAQTTITEYLLEKPTKESGNLGSESTRKKRQDNTWVYITDTKTRATPTLPTGSSLRPSIVQLHLFHHMLENLAQGNFSLRHLAGRYGLNVNETFSDSFLAQLGSLNQDLYDELAAQKSPEEEPRAATIASSQDSMDILLQHNTLATLWDFMMEQFRITFLLQDSALKGPAETEKPYSSQQSTSDLPPPFSQPTRLSPVLTARYLSAKHRHDARILGRNSFRFNPAFLKHYLEDNLQWWRGQRQARGVEMQEAWKCRSCDFRNDCEWIHERNNAALEDALRRKKMREVAGVEGGGIAKSTV